MDNIFTGIGTDKPIGTISGTITPESSKYFAANLRDLGGKGIHPMVNINSGGGGVFPGFDTIDAIHNLGLNTHNVGLAASMAGMTLMFGKHRTMNDFAMIMLHTVRNAKNKELESKMNANFRAILENTTEIPKNILDKIFINKKDVWFDARDAVRFKMVDEVISTKVDIDAKVKELVNSQIDDDFDNSIEMTNLYEIFNEAVNSLGKSQEVFFDHGKTVKAVTQLEDKLNNKYKMENEFKEVKAALGLDSSDTERDVLNSVKAKDNEIGDLKAEIELQNEENERLQNQITSMNESKAVEMVAKAHEDGKISKESISHFEGFAKSDFKACKAAIDGIVPGTVRESLVDSLADPIKKETKKEELLARGYEDIYANNPEILDDLSANDEELFNELLDEHIKKHN